MITTGKCAKTVAMLAIAGLTLVGCSSDQDQADNRGPDELDTLMASDASPHQRAAGAGTSMAMELGFDQVQAATDADLATVRENAEERAGSTEDISVEPHSCAAPIDALDWSPILASSDAITRVDFGRANFDGAGSIEVAGISDDTGGSPEATEQVAQHRQAVEDITTNCNDLTMMLADESEPDWAELEYTFTAEAVETDAGSGLLWQRYPTEGEGGQTTTALTMMTEHAGHVVMVAFIGSEEIADDEFQDIADAILATAIDQFET